MHYQEGTIPLLLFVQIFLDLSILKSYTEITKTLKLFIHFVHEFLIKKSKLYIPKCSIRDLLVKRSIWAI